MGFRDLSCKWPRFRIAEMLQCKNSFPILGLVVISCALKKLFPNSNLPLSISTVAAIFRVLELLKRFLLMIGNYPDVQFILDMFLCPSTAPKDNISPSPSRGLVDSRKWSRCVFILPPRDMSSRISNGKLVSGSDDLESRIWNNMRCGSEY